MSATSVQRLGTTPTPQEIDEWMTESLGLSERLVGTSFLGRNLTAYELVLSNNNNQEKEPINIPTILFLSLVHGNEPMGLFALLSTAEQLSQRHHSHSLRNTHDAIDARILFFPVVNIDAYMANLEYASIDLDGQPGCRRTNMRSTCNTTGFNKTRHCPFLSNDGVDLNRNFPIDWSGPYVQDFRANNSCSYNYRGPHPLSEPETQAIQGVVMQNNVSVAMSFHSRGGNGREALLIHPYTSTRPFSKMVISRQDCYRRWSGAMKAFYETGTAQETIHYTAGGSTIDWLESRNVTAFVLEIVPPCDERWCTSNRQVWRVAKRGGVTGCQLAELASLGKTLTQHGSEGVFRIATIVFISFLVCSCLVRKKRNTILAEIHRYAPRKKVVGDQERFEMQSLRDRST